MDLKQILMQLGNTMVTKHGFSPAIGDRHSSIGLSTEPIRCLTEWLNEHPAAREELAALGFAWSMPNDPPGPYHYR